MTEITPPPSRLPTAILYGDVSGCKPGDFAAPGMSGAVRSQPSRDLPGGSGIVRIAEPPLKIPSFGVTVVSGRRAWRSAANAPPLFHFLAGRRCQGENPGAGGGRAGDPEGSSPARAGDMRGGADPPRVQSVCPASGAVRVCVAGSFTTRAKKLRAVGAPAPLGWSTCRPSRWRPRRAS